VNQKYAVQYQTDFYGAFVVSSNDRRPLVLPAEDRRWFVPAVIPKVLTERDEIAKFFSALIQNFETGGAAEALGGYFEHVCRELEAERAGDLEGYFAEALRTDAKAELTYIDTSHETEDTLRLLLQDSKDEYAFQVDALLTHMNRNGPRISKSEIVDILRDEGFTSDSRRIGSNSRTLRVWAHDRVAGPGVPRQRFELWKPH
jgi:hypothetical protein